MIIWEAGFLFGCLRRICFGAGDLDDHIWPEVANIYQSALEIEHIKHPVFVWPYTSISPLRNSTPPLGVFCLSRSIAEYLILIVANGSDSLTSGYDFEYQSIGVPELCAIFSL